MKIAKASIFCRGYGTTIAILSKIIGTVTSKTESLEYSWEPKVAVISTSYSPRQILDRLIYIEYCFNKYHFLCILHGRVGPKFQSKIRFRGFGRVNPIAERPLDREFRTFLELEAKMDKLKKEIRREPSSLT